MFEFLLLLKQFFLLSQDVLYTVCNPVGKVQRIVIFKRNGIQAMVEYPFQTVVFFFPVGSQLQVGFPMRMSEKYHLILRSKISQKLHCFGYTFQMFIREDITYICNLYRKVMLSTMILITVFISDHEANSYCHEICLKFGNTLGKKML